MKNRFGWDYQSLRPLMLPPKIRYTQQESEQADKPKRHLRTWVYMLGLILICLCSGGVAI